MRRFDKVTVMVISSAGLTESGPVGLESAVLGQQALKKKATADRAKVRV